MSVLVTVRIPADPVKLQEIAKRDPNPLLAIGARGKEMGVISHRFYVNDSEVLVIDQWPDEGAFQKFFENNHEIGAIMGEAGASGPPEVTFWRNVDLGDNIG